ncbi:MAG: hypothetical protein ACFFBH_14795 [Promethearchaeota archaeon]
MENRKIIGLVLIIIGIGFTLRLIFGLSYLGPVIGLPCIIGGIFFLNG